MPTAPRRRDALDLIGKLWNAPNTLLGLLLGGLGHGCAAIGRPGRRGPPRIQLGHNAVEFLNNPAAPLGGLTLGNVTIYGDDPYDPASGWLAYELRYGHPVQAHEEQHTYQGQLLGPFYLPSNLVGGLLAVLRDGHWHGSTNWNERGPQMNPPRPWAPRDCA